MAYLDPTEFGYASADGYVITAPFGAARAKLLQGRPRYRLTDPSAKSRVDLTFDWSMGQFAAFQSFWASETNYGRDPFEVNIQFTTMLSLTNQPAYLVHALAPFSAVLYDDGLRVQVTIFVELTEQATPIEEGCDIIFAGRVDALPSNIIMGGTGTTPAIDIIAPCPEVLP